MENKTFKLQIPSEKIQIYDEVTINKGDLVLLTKSTPSNEEYVTVLLGVLKELKKSEMNHPSEIFKTFVLENPAYNLKPGELFGGQELYRLEKSLLQPFTDFPQLTLSKRVEFFIEPPQIIERLRNMKGYEKHSEWIEKLKKPYFQK